MPVFTAFRPLFVCWTWRESGSPFMSCQTASFLRFPVPCYVRLCQTMLFFCYIAGAVFVRLSAFIISILMLECQKDGGLLRRLLSGYADGQLYAGSAWQLIKEFRPHLGADLPGAGHLLDRVLRLCVHDAVQCSGVESFSGQDPLQDRAQRRMLPDLRLRH